MQNLMNVHHELTMSSIDFLDNIINPAREAAREKPVRPSDFHARVNDEIGEELNYENFVVGKTGHKTYYTMLNLEQMTLVGMRESKAVRRSVLEKIKSLSQPLPAMGEPEMIARIATHAAEQERRISHVEEKIEQIEQGTIPTGFQGYSYLQSAYGLSNAKCKQLVMGWGVPAKKIPHVAPGGIITQMSVVDEDNFHAALIMMMSEAEQRGSQWYHPKMGRFSVNGWEAA